MQTWMSTTKIEDYYKQYNYILPISFLSEQAFVSGHNVGKVIAGSNGVETTKALGSHHLIAPSRFVVRDVSPNCEYYDRDI
jgi:hypothetical protein